MKPCGMRPLLGAVQRNAGLSAEPCVTRVCDLCGHDAGRGANCDFNCDCGQITPRIVFRPNAAGSTFEIASTYRKSADIGFVCLVTINPVFDWARQGPLRERAP
jgi:hypothetical protein